MKQVKTAAQNTTRQVFCAYCATCHTNQIIDLFILFYLQFSNFVFNFLFQNAVFTYSQSNPA